MTVRGQPACHTEVSMMHITHSTMCGCRDAVEVHFCVTPTDPGQQNLPSAGAPLRFRTLLQGPYIPSPFLGWRKQISRQELRGSDERDSAALTPDKGYVTRDLQSINPSSKSKQVEILGSSPCTPKTQRIHASLIMWELARKSARSAGGPTLRSVT